MNTKFLLSVTLIFALITTVAANPAVINDTIPKTPAKNAEDFSDIEKELDALNGDTKDNDTTKIRIGKMKISVIDDGNDIIINKDDFEDDWDNDWDWDDDTNDFSFGRKKHKNRFEPHWAGIGLSMNGFLDANQSMELPKGYEYFDLNTNKSVQFDLNISELGINLIKERVGLVTGFGFRWNNYRFANSDVVVYKGDAGITYYIDSVSNYTKSKLSVTYLTVPALIEFQVPIKGESLYLAAGVEGSVKLTAKMKNKSDNGDKDKKKDDFYVNPFNYNLTARIGYGDIGLYGTYNMQQMFRENKGPEVYQYALGVTLNF